jgi:hypothetical protein
MNRRHYLLALAVCAANASPAAAAVSAEEAKSLGTTLTIYGAEKAGNKEGTIPAYTGGYTTPAPSSRPGLPPPLFASDKPSFQIDAASVDKYADKLSDGYVHLLKNYPGFRVDVYPTLRTYAAPKFVQENTLYNATHAKLADGVISGNKGGVPFPIPKTGQEVIFNFMWKWNGTDRQVGSENWFVSSAGKRSLSSGLVLSETFPYYYTDRRDPWEGKLMSAGMTDTTAPAYSAGEKTLFMGSADPINDTPQGYTYFTGQRRLRKIPNVQYDTPFPYTAGNTNYDDAWGFTGATDRYDWKLVGKKELYVPYNNNALAQAKDSESVLGPQYVTPDLVRHELHRVWVVDATLKSGARHSVPRKRFYIDEDSWAVLTVDHWDAKGQFWKSMSLLSYVYPDVPVTAHVTQIIYNVQAKSYAVMNVINHPQGGVFFKPQPSGFYTTQSLERQGVR